MTRVQMQASLVLAFPHGPLPSRSLSRAPTITKIYFQQVQRWPRVFLQPSFYFYFLIEKCSLRRHFNSGSSKESGETRVRENRDYVPRNMAFCCALTNHAVKQNAYTRAVPIAHPYVPGRAGHLQGLYSVPFQVMEMLLLLLCWHLTSKMSRFRRSNCTMVYR